MKREGIISNSIQVFLINIKTQTKRGDLKTQIKKNKRMSQLRNMSIILVVFAFVATILERTEAADHTVGDSTGWTSSAGAKFYSDWASNNTFKQNDVLGEFLFYLLKILI